MPTVTVRLSGTNETIPIFYCEEGTGSQTVIFVHGLTSSHRIFKALFLPYLRERHAKYRYTVPDMPGFGRTPALRGVHSVQTDSEILYRLIRKLRLKNPYLIGSSMGGSIVLDFLIRYPNVAGAAVVHGAPYYGEEFPLPHRLELEAYRKFLNRFPIFYPLDVWKVILGLRSSTYFLRDVFTLLKKGEYSSRLDDIIEDLKVFSPRAAIEMLWDIMHIDLRDGLKTITTPVLLVDGDRVPYRPINTLERIRRRLPKGVAHTFLLPGGHLAPYVYPQEFARGVQKFFTHIEHKKTASH